MNRRQYYNQLSKRRTLRRWASMFDVLGAVGAVIAILVSISLLVSLISWVGRDLNQSVMDIVNTGISVLLHPVGDATVVLPGAP